MRATPLGYRLHGLSSCPGEGDRNTFFDCVNSSASCRTLFSKVFLPSSRRGSRTWCCNAGIRKGHHFFSGTDCRHPALGINSGRQVYARFSARCRAVAPPATPTSPAPRSLERSAPSPPRPASPPLNRRDDLNPIDRPRHSDRHTPGFHPKSAPCPVFIRAASAAYNSRSMSSTSAN
jgi:hypothetical protein